MKWVSRNRHRANIAVGQLPFKLTMQLRLADYLGIPVPSFNESSDDEAQEWREVDCTMWLLQRRTVPVYELQFII